MKTKNTNFFSLENEKIPKINKECDLFIGNGITLEILKDTPYSKDFLCENIVNRALSVAYQKYFFNNDTPKIQFTCFIDKYSYSSETVLSQVLEQYIPNQFLQAYKIGIISKLDIDEFWKETKQILHESGNKTICEFNYAYGIKWEKITWENVKNFFRISSDLCKITLKEIQDNKWMEEEQVKKYLNEYNSLTKLKIHITDFESWFLWSDLVNELLYKLIIFKSESFKYDENYKIVIDEKQKKEILTLYTRLVDINVAVDGFKQLLVSSLYNYKDGKLVLVEYNPKPIKYLETIFRLSNNIFTLNYDNFIEKISNRTDINHLHGKADEYFGSINQINKFKIKGIEELRNNFYNATKQIKIASDSSFKHLESDFNVLTQMISIKYISILNNESNYIKEMKKKWSYIKTQKQNKVLVVLGVSLKNDLSYTLDWIKMYDEIYIGYYDKYEKINFSDTEETDPDIELIKKKIFYFDVKKLYGKYSSKYKIKKRD